MALSQSGWMSFLFVAQLPNRYQLMGLPVSYSKVLLLFQGVDECDQEVLVTEKSGEQSDALLYVRPCCVGGLKTGRWIKQLFICVTSPKVYPSEFISPPLVSSDPSREHFIFLSQLSLLIPQAPPCMVPLSAVSVSPALVPHCVRLSLNMPSWLNEPGLSMGATKQQCDGVFPLDCSHMVWFAAWQKENRGVH